MNSYDFTLRLIEQTVERATGKSATYLRNTPLCDYRKQIEAEKGEEMQVRGSEVIATPVGLVKVLC